MPVDTTLLIPYVIRVKDKKRCQAWRSLLKR